jgi:hypothetical protein
MIRKLLRLQGAAYAGEYDPPEPETYDFNCGRFFVS